MLQESIVTCLKEFENNAAKNATYIKSESNPDSGIYVYRIPASKEAREVILKSFQSNLLRQLGKDKGNSIYGAFINDQTINDKLGGLAKYDTKIRFYPNDTGNANIVSLSYTDPESGKRVMSTSRTIESFKELFGDSFEFEKLKMNQ